MAVSRLFIIDALFSVSLWLSNRFDHHSVSLHLDGGVKLHIRYVDVHLIFSILFKGRPMDFALFQSKETVDAFLDKIFGESISLSLTMSFLEQISSKRRVRLG